MNNNRGVTLVELMVSILLATIFTLAVIQLFVFSLNQQQKQQIQNEQLILIEGVEDILTAQLRYADSAYISSAGSGAAGLSSFYSQNGGFYHSDSATALAGGATGLGQSVEVLFSPVSDSVISATIRVYDDNGNQSSQTIRCRLLNLATTGVAVGVDVSSDGSAIYYTPH